VSSVVEHNKGQNGQILIATIILFTHRTYFLVIIMREVNGPI